MLLILLLLLTVHVVAGEDEARGTAVDDARKALHQSVSWGLGFGVWGLGFGVWGLGFGVCLHSGLGELQQLLRVVQTGTELERAYAHLKKVLQFYSG